jgi:hypothetical protein
MFKPAVLELVRSNGKKCGVPHMRDFKTKKVTKLRPVEA